MPSNRPWTPQRILQTLGLVTSLLPPFSPIMAPEGSTSPRKLCIAVGPSTEAQAAFHWAAKELVHPTDEVYLLNVVPSR